MNIAIVVPARLASTRFPRKLLHPIQGKPILLWTAERIRSVAPDFPLYFAVAEQELKDLLEASGYTAFLTDPDLPSGTDRLAVVNETLQADALINVQADEPLVTGEQIALLAELIRRDGYSMATLGVPIEDLTSFRDSNKVKLVRAVDGSALYFSRAPIPFDRNSTGAPGGEWFAAHNALLHLGLYAYRKEFLAAFRSLPPSPLEQIEKLEQLRALENGHRIAVGISSQMNVGIDTPEDAEDFLRRVQQ
ncbi:MAG: 3-deoxy-manno-octulosonate cytidylyltransferase [Opitutales bacterium]|nr:3-deoxy-manno-octulosonate cytidylyltransferase [Opitutales bacterium]